MEPEDGTDGVGVRSIYISVSKWNYRMLRWTDNFAFLLDLTVLLFDENPFIARIFSEIFV